MPGSIKISTACATGSGRVHFCSPPGNHDYIDPTPQLRAAGIDAISLENALHIHGGVHFYGFPYVGYLAGEWNYELGEREMTHRVANIPWEKIDVFVPHSPIYGVLDRNAQGERCGSKPLRIALQQQDRVRLVLHGHIHNAAGVAEWKGIHISNAATTQRVLTDV